MFNVGQFTIYLVPRAKIITMQKLCLQQQLKAINVYQRKKKEILLKLSLRLQYI